MKMKMRLTLAILTSFGTVILLAWFKMAVVVTLPQPWGLPSQKLSNDQELSQKEEGEDAYISLDSKISHNNTSLFFHSYSSNAKVTQRYLQETKTPASNNANTLWRKQNTVGSKNATNLYYENKILIFTSYRTGSTFTGELLRQNPNVFYLFEPLKLPSLLSRDNYLQDHIVEYLDDCFNCKFSGLVQDSKRFYPVENSMRQTWYMKIFDQSLTRHGHASLMQMENICKQYDVQAIKIIRGNRIQNVFPLMEKGVKVIHLVRDPRGTITSRLQIESLKTKKPLDVYFKEEKTIQSVKSECLRYSNTYDMLLGKKVYQKNQQQLLNQQYRLVRYEDIAYNPIKIAKEIYKFLNLPMPDEVSKWLSKSTIQSQSAANVNPNEKLKILSQAYSTSRNSSATAEAWRNKMPFPINLEIQRECGTMLRNFGYRRVYSRTEYKDLTMSLVRDLIGKVDHVIT